MIPRILALIALVAFPAAAQAGFQATKQPAVTTIAAPVYQLRIYELIPEKRSAFHKRFRDHASRIMKLHGFKILAMWETASKEKPEFAYLLEWRDEGEMKLAWSRFMADQEWAAIKAETRARDGSIMGGIQDRVMRRMSYSPSL